MYLRSTARRLQAQPDGESDSDPSLRHLHQVLCAEIPHALYSCVLPNRACIIAFIPEMILNIEMCNCTYIKVFHFNIEMLQLAVLCQNTLPELTMTFSCQ